MESEDNRSKAVDPIASTESLTTSIESESFETWTLVTESANKRPTKTALETQYPLNEEDRIELIEKNENNKREKENLDDLSDGISIISDNESAGRASPPPLISDSPSLLSEISSTEFDIQNKHMQYESLTPPENPKEMEPSSQIEPLPDKHTADNQESESIAEEIPQTFLGIGMRGIFYISILIALAAFIGKMKYPEWEQISVSSQLSPINDRIEDLELQNNLLRAEIDLLNKQVSYLNQQKDKVAPKGESKSSNKQEQDRKQYKSPTKDRPTKDRPTKERPKIWPGGGNIQFGEPIEPIYIPASNGCDKSGRKFDAKPREAPTNQQFKREKMVKQEDVKKYPSSKEYIDQRPVKDEKKYDKEKTAYETHPTYPKINYPPEDERFERKYSKHDNGRNYDRETRKTDQKAYNSKEDFEDDKYIQQRKRRWENDYPHEEYSSKRDKNLKHNDDWHEKMMQNREDVRKERDQHNTNNWYIERGNSREEARVFVKGDRLKGDK